MSSYLRVSTLILFSSLFCSFPLEAKYLIGVGKADITGVAVGSGMMCYAELGQISSGIHDRQWARTFAIVDEGSQSRLIIVVVDAGVFFSSLYQAVLAELQNDYPGYYDEESIIITATHTHSAVSGQSHHFLYNMPGGRYDDLAFDRMVSGIIKSIHIAHDDLAPGKIFFNDGLLENASANRSLQAFLNNPDKKELPGSIDAQMQLLKFERQDKPVGVLAWFATHGVSFPKTNTLLSSDNKGYAAWLFERYAKKQWPDSRFVAAFPQTNAGDMTPNLNLDGTGPDKTPSQNVRTIGNRQYQKALDLFLSAEKEVTGPVRSAYKGVHFSQLLIQPEFSGKNQTLTACEPAMGYGFAAGTEDGRPHWLFTAACNLYEGKLNRNGFSLLADYLSQPECGDEECQKPKPLLLALNSEKNYQFLNHFVLWGNMPAEVINNPWVPPVLPLLLVELGSISIAAVPAEFTVMAGRRVRKTIASESNKSLNHVILAGYSNDYLSYVTTAEEYQAQHYEGGSTLFGPLTLDAYRQVFSELSRELDSGKQETESSPAMDLSHHYTGVKRAPVYDSALYEAAFGDVIRQTSGSVYAGETISTEFVSSHPQNGLYLDSFLYVQQQDPLTGEWLNIANDDDWNTRIYWSMPDRSATVEWETDKQLREGYYRLEHKGIARNRQSVLGGEDEFEEYVGYSAPVYVRHLD